MLEGLVLADVEFSTSEEKATFTMPEFCLRNVDNVEFIAGGMLAGKTYEDIEKDLQKLKYKKMNNSIKF